MKRQMKDLFDMTRQERRGTILLLALIAVVLVGTLCVRSCYAHGDEFQYSSAVQEFEADIDSSHVTVSAPATHKAKEKKRSAKKQHKKEPDSKRHDHSPRRLDPVPQF